MVGAQRRRQVVPRILDPRVGWWSFRSAAAHSLNFRLEKESMETTTRYITMKVVLPVIDDVNYRDEVDQTQFTLYMVLHNLSELIEEIVQYGDPMHWPEGALVNAARGLLNMEAARMSYLAAQYNKALVEAQVASRAILQIPPSCKSTTGRHGLPTKEDVRAHMGYGKPPGSG